MGFVNWGSFLIQTINLTIILYVLNRYLLQPYLRYLDAENEKRAEMEHTIAEVETIRDAARKEAEHTITVARREAEDIRTKAKMLAAKEAENTLDAARIEADNIVHRAQADQERDRRTLEDALRGRVLDVAIRLNGKLFGETQTHRDFVANSLQEEIKL